VELTSPGKLPGRELNSSTSLTVRHLYQHLSKRQWWRLLLEKTTTPWCISGTTSTTPWTWRIHSFMGKQPWHKNFFHNWTQIWQCLEGARATPWITCYKIGSSTWCCWSSLLIWFLLGPLQFQLYGYVSCGYGLLSTRMDHPEPSSFLFPSQQSQGPLLNNQVSLSHQNLAASMVGYESCLLPW